MNLSTRDMVKVSLFASLTAVGSLIAIPLPFNLVPITLQTFFTYLAGIILGPWLGALSQLIYILLGCLNLPVFAGGTAGYAVLLGPSGGYLWGFILGSFFIGILAAQKRGPGWIIVSLLVGTAIIYACGLIQLMAIAHLSLPRAFWLGMAVFLPGDFLKILLVSQLVKKLPPKLL